jgi:hypothetical protein
MKDVADDEIGGGPETAAGGISEQKAPEVHPAYTGQCNRDQAHTGDELRDQQSARATLGERALGFANARIGLKGELAKEAQDGSAFESAQVEPHAIADECAAYSRQQREKKRVPVIAHHSAHEQNHGIRRDRQSERHGRKVTKQKQVPMTQQEISERQQVQAVSALIVAGTRSSLDKRCEAGGSGGTLLHPEDPREVQTGYRPAAPFLASMAGVRSSTPAAEDEADGSPSAACGCNPRE